MNIPDDLPPHDLLTGAALLLDFDGTLVPIADRPDAVVVDQALRDLLGDLVRRLDGRVALISGRPAGEVADLIDSPALSIAGSHGMEFRYSDGRVEIADRPDALAIVRDAMNRLADRWPGALVEDKPLGAAFHYRQAPEARDAAETLAAELVSEHGLRLQPGKMLIEVRAGGGDKGVALARLMREPHMVGARPVFIGDDDTDEPAFIAAADLGGAGILVGPPRESAAQWRLPDVDAALAWLARQEAVA